MAAAISGLSTIIYDDNIFSEVITDQKSDIHIFTLLSCGVIQYTFLYMDITSKCVTLYMKQRIR